MSRFSPVIDIRKSVAAVKLSMVNQATRVNKAGQAVMRNEAVAVMTLASKYAPKKSGALENPKNWKVQTEASGPNRRNSFQVVLRESAVARKTKAGRVIRLREYARWVHDEFYKLGKGSKAKARSLGYPTINSGNAKYVGRLYLTRAANHRRAICRLNVLKAISGELN